MLKHNYFYHHKGMTILVITSCLFISQICTSAFGKSFEVQKATDPIDGKTTTTLSCTSMDGKATLKVVNTDKSIVQLIIETPSRIKSDSYKGSDPAALVQLRTTASEDSYGHEMYIDRHTYKSVALYMNPRHGVWIETKGRAVWGHSLSTMLKGEKFQAKFASFGGDSFTWDLQGKGSEEFHKELDVILAKAKDMAPKKLNQIAGNNTATDVIKKDIQKTAYEDVRSLKSKLRRPLTKYLVEVNAKKGAVRHRLKNENDVLKKDWYVEAYLRAFNAR